MNEEIKTKLTEAGMNVDDALERFMNSESMLEKFLKKFMADPSYKSLIDAVNANDNDAAFAASHTLKGVAANFSFEELRAKSSDSCEEFRAGRFESGAEIVKGVTTAYEKIIETLTAIYGAE